jgi:hypothetical protein
LSFAPANVIKNYIKRWTNREASIFGIWMAQSGRKLAISGNND